MPAHSGPAHLEQGGNRYRDVGDCDVATHERGLRKGRGTQNAYATLAEILNAAFKFSRKGELGLDEGQTSGAYFQHLGEAWVLTALSFCGMLHWLG